MKQEATSEEHPLSRLWSAMSKQENNELLNRYAEELHENHERFERLGPKLVDLDARCDVVDSELARLVNEGGKLRAECSQASKRDVEYEERADKLYEEYQRVISNDPPVIGVVRAFEVFTSRAESARERVKLNEERAELDRFRDAQTDCWLELHRKLKENDAEFIECLKKRQELNELSNEIYREWAEVDRRSVEIYEGFASAVKKRENL